MWIRIKSEKELLRESVDRLNYKVQLMEAVNELQNDIYGEEMYDEDTGKAMSWLKEKLQKVCPSPDKLKEFFDGLGKKMDAKVQGCKFDSVKNAWNSLKGMIAATDIPDEQGDEGGEEEEEEPQENPEVGDEMDAGAEGDETDGELAAESLMLEESMYEEGFWDSIKSGWNKLTGKGDEEPTPARGRGRKTTAKKGNAKKGTVKRGVAKKGAVKPGAAKKGTVKKGAKRAVAKKGNVKKGGKKGKQEIKTWKSKVWEFIKGHWKQIAVILIVCLALYFLGGWVAALFAKSGTAVAATKAVTSGASKFKLPIGMTKLPPGAKLIGNGVVKFANGGYLAAPDGDIDVDF